MRYALAGRHDNYHADVLHRTRGGASHPAKLGHTLKFLITARNYSRTAGIIPNGGREINGAGREAISRRWDLPPGTTLDERATAKAHLLHRDVLFGALKLHF
jgi:hypothetical protein